MSDGDEPGQPRHLVAVPAQPGHELTPVEPSGPPVYADIRQAPERKQILPVWLSNREELAHATRRARGYAWHSARYHGLRSPVYLTQALFWAGVGVARVMGRQLAWWWVADAVRLEAQAARNLDSREWKGIHGPAKKTRKFRGYVMAAEAITLVVGVSLARIYAPWWGLALAGCVALPVLARVGRPEGRRIVQPAHVPQQYEVLTQDVITRALGSLGIDGINKWLREGREIDFTPGPVRQDGPGWRADMNLPYGVTATMIIDKREQLASGLRRPLGAVWPEPATSEHAGRLELWVGQQDISKAKAPVWPLLKAGQADVFKPFPFAADVRGRRVAAPLMYHNWLIGSIPRQGKTATVRELGCGVALDPLAEMWVHELKGTGDLDPLEAVAHRFVSGIDDDSVAYAAESLKLLRREIEQRAPRIKALPLALCPEKRVTREIAAKRNLRLWPVVCIVDECQNLFAHDKYGKQAGEDAEVIIKVGPAMGVVLILATQRPDAKSLPTGVRGNVSIRFCLKVMGQEENDMILGTSMYKNGIRATTFRPKIDAGLGYLLSEEAPQVVRTYFLDVPAAKSVVARARAARERAGTLSGVAAEQDYGEAVRDVLGDVLACFGNDSGLHWDLLATRLAQRWPDRWAGVTGDAMSAQCRDLGVPSVSVRWPSGRLGTVKKGCRRDDVESAEHRNTAGQVV